MRTKLKLTTLLSCAILVAAAPGQGERNASGGKLLPAQAAFDVRHYELRLRVDPDAQAIKGTLTMKAAALENLRGVVLDLDPALSVANVRWDGKKVMHRHEGGRISVKAPAQVAAGVEFEVAVDYGGKPRVAPNPPWNGGFTWSRTQDGHPWIATSCQGEGADLWWPCKDHPSDKAESMDLFITVPMGLVCASNGTLEGTEDGDDGRTFHWKVANPINNYCVALNIAPYEVIEETLTSVAGGEIPVRFWVLPENLERGKKFMAEILDHLRHMEEVCGPYPFRNEKYGVVETPHLGMEHQTIIAYGNRYRLGPHKYDWLHHHEMSHEWWANLVTCRDWKDMWIHEGFGTYMQALYLESRRGQKTYQIEMASKRRGIANRRPVAPREVRDSKEIYFGDGGGNDSDMYNKGSWILHTLRWVMEDEPFFRALRLMAYPDPEKEKVTDGTQVRFSDTHEIRGIAEKVHGQDLRWFFDVYLHQPALPELQVQEVAGKLRLRWKTPGDLPFPMPVPVKVGEEIQRVEMKDGAGSVDLPRGAKWEVDPDQRLLKEEPRRRRGR